MGQRRTVLITNIWLANWAGTEVVVRDLALGLLARGHRPIVYSPSLGGIAETIAARGIAVIDDLRRLGEAPDIIHAHHTIPCGEALLRFPDVPAIYVCHAFSHWSEAPVHFPQIGAYVAVDEACRDRLVHIEGVDPRRVVIFPNAVDLGRIPSRPAPLRSRPRRAVAFGKAALTPEPRQACERLGIAFDAFDGITGRLSTAPERELVECDVVFATARCALEALCCGCAVIACDARGFAGLVTTDNFDMLRALNFGLRSLTAATTVERCVDAMARYDAADATRVSQRARAEADLGKQLDAFEALYDEVLTGARRPVVTAEAREQAMARFLYENLPRRPGDARWPVLIEQEELRHDAESLQRRVGELNDRLAATQGAYDRASQERDQARSERDRAQARLTDLRHSRMLAVGRLLRRLAGLPTPY